MAALRAKWGRHVTHFYRLEAGRRGRLRWAATIPLMALSPLAELPVVLFSDRIAGPRTRALAFAGLVQIRLFRAWRMLLAHARTAPARPPAALEPPVSRAAFVLTGARKLAK